MIAVMTDMTSETDVADGPPRRKSPLRMALRGAFAACGLLMIAILLSDPSVRRQLEAASAMVGSLLSSSEEVAMSDAAPEAVAMPLPEAEPGAVPKVTAMPTSRVPVRRGSISN